ncbi:zinc-ribbon domain-containing protein [Actinoplanes sp. M2I2]|uniref:zinc-ribbon domain-containing protein n=1 Tax=Actinoplanes sp. M2I2 TaxID=1734444 RepID=UPI002020FC2F|nr:zinc-ribbon domain-containing protein [Actinoplanes sp. M2I2]
MFLIFGFRTKPVALGWVGAPCRVCGHTGSQLLIREVTRFSLFFIPLIKVRTRYVLECHNPMCRSVNRISGGEAENLMRGGVRAA